MCKNAMMDLGTSVFSDGKFVTSEYTGRSIRCTKKFWALDLIQPK